MKQVQLGKSNLQVSQLALGCMRMASLSVEDSAKVIDAALQVGMNFFDHADIYGAGQSETTFAKAVKALGLSRDELILQSKCGIRKGFFDFSKEHILESVDGILSRLQTDYLDVLLLHRPDALMEADEVAEAFTTLQQSGKVRHFGVSNQHPGQMALLQHYLDQPIVANQLQFGPAHTPLIDAGFNVNMLNEASLDHDHMTLNYCQLHHITVQPWSPFQVDLGQGLFMSHPNYTTLTQTLEDYAAHYDVSLEAIVMAWLLRYPAMMQPIVGSMNPERIAKIAKGTEVTLTREEWYAIYRSAGHVLP